MSLLLLLISLMHLLCIKVIISLTSNMFAQYQTCVHQNKQVLSIIVWMSSRSQVFVVWQQCECQWSLDSDWPVSCQSLTEAIWMGWDSVMGVAAEAEILAPVVLLCCTAARSCACVCNCTDGKNTIWSSSKALNQASARIIQFIIIEYSQIL